MELSTPVSAAVRTAGEADRVPERLKHRWSVSHNLLSGITLGGWLRLLRENRFAVDAVYGHRAAFVTALSILNSAWCAVEKWRFGHAVGDIEPPEDPLFVLGHWRSGTTHLHNLLALDKERFAYPNTYDVVNPLSFLSSEPINKRLFTWLLPKTRPMDNMALGFDSPQEDELALCLLCGKSPYLAIAFPSREAHYRRYLTFHGVAEEETQEWKQAFGLFVRKLTLKYQRPLILKSPPHTARIRLLLQLFPNARFVHIRRNPYDVFRSTQHYFDTAAWYGYLQRPDRSSVDQQILERYVELYEAYFEDRPLIPRGRLHELAFEDLERDPVGEVRRAYEALQIGGFESVEPCLGAYVKSQRGYRKNPLRPLSGPLRDRVATAWRPCFDEWGYA